jgi:hypothetical protein
MCPSYVPIMYCEKMAHNRHIVSSTCWSLNFLWKTETRQDSSTSDFVVCVCGDVCISISSVRRWVKHFKDGNIEIADQPWCGWPRTAVIEHKEQKVDELIRQDRRITARETAAQLEWGTMQSRIWWRFWGIGNLLPLVFPFPYRQLKRTARNWELLSHPPHSSDLAPSDYLLFGPLKDHLRGHHYETDEAVQEAVRSWLRGAGTDFYRWGIFKILQR